ncbi:MAG: DUF1730 domain-containing protein [Clostridia bacterium]|nr:DUF1730 domain-containing protein [Clostridia bacterium]
MTDKILSELTPQYGFCSFAKIQDRLIDCRAKSRIPENAKTVIVCLFPYFLGNDKYDGSDISKYAVVPDYHDTITARLTEVCDKLKEAFPDEEFVTFTDNSPIPEVFAAVNAGLGVRGKNSLFISHEYGSWVFIGEIVTTKEYPQSSAGAVDCMNCGKCVKACPTGSITESGINTDTCLSNITQCKGELSETEKKLIMDSGCIWGCDICQNVCPMNKNIKINPLEAFTKDVRLKADADNLEGRAYAWRGRKVIERNINLLKENKS